ncbi:MAG: TadE/TadG family type IV pilus assembly protein [Janthinobacterium lividum]
MRLRRRLQRGAALVEFALISGLLFLILFGIIEVGLLLGDQAQVGQSAREAARAAAAGSTVEAADASAVSAGSGLHLTAASVILEKSADGGSTWAALGDTAAGTNNAAAGNLIRATVTYSHPLVTTYIFTGSTKLLTSKMVMQRE